MKMTIAVFLLLACGSPQAKPPVQTNAATLRQEASRLMETACEQLDRGEHGAAAVTLEKAIAHHQILKDPKEEAVAWTQLGQVYFALSAWDQADRAYRKAPALAGTTGSESTEAVSEMLARMKAASQYGPSSAFLRSFNKDLDLFPGGALMFDHFWPFFNELGAMIANWNMIGGNLTTSCAALSRRRMEDMLALMEGRNLFAEGKFAAAREAWQERLEKSVNSELRSGFQAGIGATYLKEKNADAAIGWFKQAADSAERPLQSIKDPELMTSYVGSERRWYYDITIETLLQNGRPDEAFDYSERSRARAFLQMLGNGRLRRQRERSNAEYASLTTIQPLSIEEVRRGLPANTTLIVYFVSTYGVRAFVIDAASLHYSALPFDHASLERTVSWATGFRASAARGMAPDDPAAGAAGSGEEAFELLIAPLRMHLRNRRLIIVPHGELHYVPFAALRDAARGRYLIEDYTLTYSPSASALRFLRAKETPFHGQALVLGDPEAGLRKLPGSAREAAAVAHAFATTAKLGQRASEDLVYRLDGRIDLLHIAAHGKYDPTRPLRSHVALAPGGQRDGKLEVQEILSEVDLQGVNLVVLSACQTAAGKRGGGDDVVGLTRAILYAGSPAVISTLWDIEDDASAVLMEKFYGQLHSGVSAADALRDAQLLHSQAYTDARLWAGFVLSGDPLGRWISPAVTNQ